jgi:hypothetical protein
LRIDPAEADDIRSSVGQEMIVKHIDNNGGVMPVFRAKPNLTFQHHRMAIGEVINFAMKFNAQRDVWPKLFIDVSPRTKSPIKFPTRISRLVPDRKRCAKKFKSIKFWTVGKIGDFNLFLPSQIGVT